MQFIKKNILARVKKVKAELKQEEYPLPKPAK